MSPKFVDTLVGKAFVQGHHGLAASIALGFAGFLRTGDMLQMQFQHLARYPTGGILALPLAKIGRRRGHREMAPIECPIAPRLVVLAARSAMPGYSIAPPPLSFRAWWREAIAEFGLDPVVWRPYGLRRGGATWHFQQTGSLESTLFRGRWSSLSSARGYLVEAMALLAQQSLE